VNRSSGGLQIPDLEAGRAGWLVCVVGVVLLVLPASDWNIPDSRGASYPLVLAVAAGAILGALAAVRRYRGEDARPAPLEVLATLTGVAAVLGALTIMPTQPLRDLGVYLRAGDAFAAGSPVYMDRILPAIPVDRTQYPFLYPPLLLPPLAFLAGAPRLAVDIAWVAGSLATLCLALRAFGLPWRWVVAAVAWRPIFEGLWVGNVAVPLLACLALAIRHPSLLVVPPVFKAYSGTAALWLIRERRWRSLVLGSVAVAAAVALTLPMTGLELWRSWVAGLGWFARSQPVFPGYLYGIALQRFVGFVPALALGILVLGAALLARGREGLARLGLATPVLAQSVFLHGLLVAIPSMAGLRPAVLWLGLASMSFGPTPGSWLGPGLAIASWAAPALRRSAAAVGRARVPDPLGGAPEPWLVEPMPAGEDGVDTEREAALGSA